MSDPTVAAFLKLVAGRRGHFRMESGHHSGLWLDLDPIFAVPAFIEPFVAALARALKPYNVDIVCGPLLGGAFLAQLLAPALHAEFCFTQRVMPAERDGLYPAQYQLPPSLESRVRGKRVAIVDDVMSAGSALRATYAELCDHGGVPVVAGALLLLGSVGADYFSQKGVAVEAVVRDEYEVWLTADCPLCRTGVPLVDITASQVAMNEP